MSQNSQSHHFQEPVHMPASASQGVGRGQLGNGQAVNGRAGNGGRAVYSNHDNGQSQSHFVRSPEPNNGIGHAQQGRHVEEDIFQDHRDEAIFINANRYTGRVKFFRVLLPVIGVLIILGLVVAYVYSQTGIENVTIEKIGTDEGGRLVMKQPTLDGVDQSQRPYKLTAKQAIQDPRNPQQVELDEILANVPMPDGLFANIAAERGAYDGDAKTLKLGGVIDVVTDDGMSAKLNGADIDINAGSLRTQNPVLFNSQQAIISADRMSIEENGDKIVFENRVKMTLYPDKLKERFSQQNGGESQ